MIFVPRKGRTKNECAAGGRHGSSLLFALILVALPFHCRALPARLVLALDGVAYRDMQALQSGFTRTNFWGRTHRLRAFTVDEGYFPVSRMISTFPSASDVAWTDIFGNHPLPGYQRTYYSAAANSLIALNGVTTTVEHERQMDFQVQNGVYRAMGYLFPVHAFRHEMRELAANFWESARPASNYYAYFRASDDAQHLDRDIFGLLCELDRNLQHLRTQYQARAGRDLEIVILSDHGHNHAGRGIRAQEGAFLEQSGYHVVKSVAGPRDVVLPIVGVENWVEIHCDPRETEKLAQRLCSLAGMDVLAAALPDQPSRYLVLNSKGERADIDWNPARDSFRYAPVSGDPLQYLPVTAALARNHQLEAGGFATAEAWMAATVGQHYPLALERIVRGLTRGALNPANILVSLDNHYVNDSWAVQQGSRLVTCGSTHGGLDDLCSDGILLSNFSPTRDTSTSRVAAQFEDFPGVRNYRAETAGAELVTRQELALTRILRDPVDRGFQQLSSAGVYLRMWSPRLAALDHKASVGVELEKIPRYATSPGPRQVTLDRPLALGGGSANERIYALPADLKLEPLTEYKMSGWIQDEPGAGPLFALSFRTSRDGQPAAF
jgi:hypothetical protein